jgi:hypothetical protein
MCLQLDSVSFRLCSSSAANELNTELTPHFFTSILRTDLFVTCFVNAGIIAVPIRNKKSNISSEFVYLIAALSQFLQ